MRVGVGDKDAFKSGREVSVQAASDNKQVTGGRVSTVSGFAQADPDAGKDIPGYDVTVDVADTEGLSDDQDVVVIAQAGEAVSGLAVPVTALREDGSDSYVVLAGAEGKHVPVTVKQVSEGYAVLSDPTLKAGDEIVVSAK